jgi:archaetidylinositol phosphate synthase
MSQPRGIGTLDRLRGSLASVLSKVGASAARVIPSPTAWTLVGLAFAVLASVYFAEGNPPLAGLFLLLSGFFDVVDGAVARATGRTSPRGAFLDSTLDRVSEVLVYLGIIWGNPAVAFVVLLALSMSLLVSYSRAKGDALGVNLAGVGIGERSERLVVLIVTSFLSLVVLGVVIVAAIAFLTFIERTIKVTRALNPKPEAALGP